MTRYALLSGILILFCCILLAACVNSPGNGTPTPTSPPTTTPIPDNRTCTTDDDCVPAQCCHPTGCINAAYKGVCTQLCTAVCEGPIDCGAGHCGCVQGVCGVIPGTIPPTTISPVGGNVTVNLSARALSFDQTMITVPAGSRVTLHFSNEDAGVQHNVAIYTTAVPPDVVFRGGVITGPATVDYTFTAPAAPGEYVFTCDVHPDRMFGKFVVAG